MTDKHQKFMKEAIKQAKKAGEKSEIPIGAVIVRDEKIIARGYNRRICDKNPTAHAEIEALKKAGKKEGAWNLSGCDMYVTLEPCIMCYGAALNSRIDNIYFGAYDSKFGIGDLKNSGAINFNHTLNLQGGILENECSKILTDFFSQLRKNKNQK